MITYMDAALKEKWLEALRSGKYKQGKNCLRNQNNTFCCLGVLCDIIGPDNWVKAGEEHFYWNYEGKVEFELPPINAHLFWDDKGVSQNNFKVARTSGKIYTCPTAYITELNDTGYTFEDLANIIEDQVVGV